MKMPGHRSGFHICDILDLNSSTNEPKLAGLSESLSAQPADVSTSNNTTETTTSTSPQLTPISNNTISPTPATTVLGPVSSGSYPNVPSRTTPLGQTIPNNNNNNNLQQHLSDEALAAHQHHHHQFAVAAAAAAANRHHNHHHPHHHNSNMLGSSPYQLPSNINHAMLSAEAAVAAGAYQSMFPNSKAWFPDHDHYGE